jgi:hypothetical protein
MDGLSTMCTKHQAIKAQFQRSRSDKPCPFMGKARIVCVNYPNNVSLARAFQKFVLSKPSDAQELLCTAVMGCSEVLGHRNVCAVGSSVWHIAYTLSTCITMLHV